MGHPLERNEAHPATKLPNTRPTIDRLIADIKNPPSFIGEILLEKIIFNNQAW